MRTTCSRTSPSGMRARKRCRPVVSSMPASGVSPTSSPSNVEIGAGCVIGARAVLTSQVKLGCHVVIGVGAIVSHDVELEDFATLAPGVILTGAVRVGRAAELGAGATVIPGRSVGAGAVVGAQAVVVDDVAAKSVVVGVPAAPVRR